MSNERITEQIVRNLLTDKGYYDNKTIIVEEQKSANSRINNLLCKASKSGKGGTGYPEFMVSFKNKPEDLIVIECKANLSNHRSKNIQHYTNTAKDYAVDGVLWYASHLKNEYNVTAIAVSGENEKDKKVSSFLWLKNNYTFIETQNKIFPTPDEVSSIIIEQQTPFSQDGLIKKANCYNEILEDYAIPEVERCTLMSAILIALQHKPFCTGYLEYTHNQNKDLINALLQACESVLRGNTLSKDKIDVIKNEYSKFQTNSDFNSQEIYNNKKKKNEPNTLLRDFIQKIHSEILPYINNNEFDILGQFYTVFIRYAGSDKKTGLVLTPNHITDFFCKIADLNKHDVVFDPCCGTAGFLVSAMNCMLDIARYDTQKRKEIKSNQIVGIEKRADMFAHACSNMMMRGDGKSHILYGDCFDESNKDEIKKLRPTKTFQNPPYRKDNNAEQLEFLENALDCIESGGIGMAIVKMGCVVSSKKDVIEAKKRLLDNHTLEGVFSMPTELFNPAASVPTVIIIFRAKQPHPKEYKSFFGYFKDDGFKITKNKRIDTGKWQEIERNWLTTFRNKDNIPGLSARHCISNKDEWCAEAYMDTDYSQLTENNFIKTVKDYVAFQFLNGYIEQVSNTTFLNKNVNLQDREWKWFDYKGIFNIRKGFYNKKPEHESDGHIPFIGATEFNNGVTSRNKLKTIEDTTKTGNEVNHTIEDKLFENCITISNNGSVGCAFYHSQQITCSHDVNPIFIRNKKLNAYIAMFLCTIIGLEKFRWAYGRKWRPVRMPESKIKLPVNTDNLPDWQFMEDYIKSLPYSNNLQNTINTEESGVSQEN